MKRSELDELFNTLRKDVSSLFDTTSVDRVDCDEAGNYSLVLKKEIKDNTDRVKRILGAFYPHYSAQFLPALYQNVHTHQLPSGFRSVEEMVRREDRKCITENYDIRNILLLLRKEGVIEFGKTPLCGDGDVSAYLKDLIQSSGLPYRDTMMALLEDQNETDEPLVIDDDPDEPQGEKLDRGILLLSLLSPEEIFEYGGETSLIGLDTRGNFSTIFEGTPFQRIASLAYLGSSKPRELFSHLKFKLGWGEWEVTQLAEAIVPKEGKGEAKVALPGPEYRNILRQAIRSGVSVSGWLFKSEVAMLTPDEGIFAWMFDTVDESVAQFIMHREGYFLLALDETSRKAFLHGDSFFELRRYIVDNSFLRDVYQRLVQPDWSYPGDYFTYYEINTKDPSQLVRFLNCGESESEGDLTLQTVLRGYDPEEENEFYRMIPHSQIVEEGYLLDMDIYNSREYRECKNPVRLGEIMTLLKGESRRIAPYKMERYYDTIHDLNDPKYAYVGQLGDDPLANLEEVTKAYPMSDDFDGDIVIDETAVLLLKSDWPMQPTWVATESRGKVLLAGNMKSDDVKAFSVDVTNTYPWYLAYQISKLERQFRLRCGADGKISDAALLRMYIDLPSLEDQKNYVYGIISERIERQRRQIGNEAVFNLAHTIGAPSLRIRSLLGNLLDLCRGDAGKVTMLKQIEHNFDYVSRVVESARDYETAKVLLKEMRILPILEGFLSTVPSLPFGFDPTMDRSEIEEGLAIKVDKTLFLIMLDNILRNAHRHGFNKRVSSNNRVQFDLSVVTMEDGPYEPSSERKQGKHYLLLSVCNNGQELEESFTVKDFVTRGKKGKETGNTGQGGYDIYQIVKKFGGKLNIRRSSDWNFIIDILLPVSSGIDTEKTYDEYGYGKPI